jgi:hypothetical protein
MNTNNVEHTTYNITLEDLQTQIEMVLYAYINTKMTKSYLYYRVLDRINTNNNYVHPEFRKKFELIYKYYLPYIKEIKIELVNNVNTIEIIHEIKESSIKTLNNSQESLIDLSIKTSNNSIESLIDSSIKISNDTLKKSSKIKILKVDDILPEYQEEELLNYMLDNGTKIELELINPSNDNTFYHDCIKYPILINKLIIFNKMNYDIKNKNNLTPLECITNLEVANILINNIYIKSSNQQNQIKKLKYNQYILILLIIIVYIYIFVSLNNFIYK